MAKGKSKVQPRTYNCPNEECDGKFIATDIRNNDGKCPHCGLLVEYQRVKNPDKPGFSGKYILVSMSKIGHTQDDDRSSDPYHLDEWYIRRGSPTTYPVVYDIKPENKGAGPDHVTLYKNVGTMTDLYCKSCRRYNQTTGTVSGGETKFKCRCKATNLVLFR